MTFDPTQNRVLAHNDAAPVMLVSSAVPAGEVWFVDPVTCALVGRIINVSTEADAVSHAKAMAKAGCV